MSKDGYFARSAEQKRPFFASHAILKRHIENCWAETLGLDGAVFPMPSYPDPEWARETLAGDMPYFLFDETLMATTLGFTRGTYLPFYMSDGSELTPEEHFGKWVELTGVVEESGYASNWAFYVGDLLVITGKDVTEFGKTFPGSLRWPGTRFPAPGAAPGRQQPGRTDCQYGIVLAGHSKMLFALSLLLWPPVIINDVYWNDTVFAVHALRGIGVPDANIFVAASSYAGTPVPGTAAPGVAVANNGTLQGMRNTIRAARNAIGARLKRNEICTLYVITTGHGGQVPDAGAADPVPGDEADGQDETLRALDGHFRDDDFAGEFAPLMVNNSRPGNLEIFVLMEQCRSGGFIPEMAPGRIVTHIATACTEKQDSIVADTEGPYNEFLYHFLSALAGQDPYGVPVNADTPPRDGTVTWREAFDYARLMDNQPEIPQFQ